jgi:hypothetical protein
LNQTKPVSGTIQTKILIQIKMKEFKVSKFKSLCPGFLYFVWQIFMFVEIIFSIPT